MKAKKNQRFLRLTLIVISLLLLFEVPLYIVNFRSVQQWFLKTYKPFSPWVVSVDQLTISPLHFTVEIKNLRMEHPNGNQIVVESLFAKANPLRFFSRGKLVLDPFIIQSPAITIVKNPKQDQPKKGFKLRTLLFLQSILIDKGKINQAVLHLPEQKDLTAENITVLLDPGLLRGIKLGLDFQELWLTQAGEKIDGAQGIHMKFFTNFDNWSKTFPYVDDIDGDLLVNEAKTGKLAPDKIEAKLALKNSGLAMKTFSVSIGGKQLLGKLESNVNDQTFQLQLNIPEPIALAELGSPTRTFNMAGDLKAQLDLKGSGFNLETSQGSGSLNATHRFQDSPEYPADAALKFQWQKGVLQLKEGNVTTDNAGIETLGSIDLKPFSLHLKLKANQFPIQRFFEKFLDKNLHPIYGKGTFDATLDGLKEKIHLQLKGEAQDGGYGFVKVEKVAVDLDITYQKLKLAGKIFRGGNQTGLADFQIDYGPKTSDDLPRPKTIHLKANLNGESLASTLPDSPFTGLASAELTLQGPAKDFKGEGTLHAADGTVFHQGFEKVDIHFRLFPKQLIIDQAEGNYEDIPFQFSKPVTFDFMEGGFKAYGSPLAGFELNSQYQSASKKWDIEKMIYQEPGYPDHLLKLAGSIQPGNVQLKGEGTVELSKLKPFTQQIRDGEGPLRFQLALNGSFDNPLLNGKIIFEENTLSLRAYPYAAEDLNGTILFNGNKIQTENLEGVLGTGTFHLQGFLTHSMGKALAFDLAFNGNELYYRDLPGSFRMEYDAHLTLKGPALNPTLAGSLDILDGKYTKDFNIIEELKEAPKASREIQEAASEDFPLALDLKVRNLGDLTIDNNIGRIELTSNVDIKGTKFSPQIKGTVEVTEGIIRYLGLDLDITRGFMEFRDPYIFPYLEIHAEKDLNDTHVTAKLYGKTNNLRMDLAGNSARGGPLEKKDVLSLILFGMTASERAELATFQQLELGPALAAEQIAHVLQRPLEKATSLDILRMEATPTREGRIQKFYLGKRINDRLSVEFASEINSEEAVQTFLVEYWLTDFLIFKGARSTQQNYQLNVGVRLTGR